MKLADFDYKYPKELVAQHPLPRRDASRMMVVDRQTRSWRHAGVADLPDFLREGDLLVLNDSKVVPARLFGTRGNGEPIELLVVEPAPAGCRPSKRFPRDSSASPQNDTPVVTLSEAKGPDESRGKTWRCLLKNAKRIRKGEKFFFGMHATAAATGTESPFLLVEFAPGSLDLAMKYHGVPPLPPYIGREGFEAYTNEDRERYQTIYARHPGSAAAPTAGLHLTGELMERLKKRNIEIACITLHVGIDTFAPVRGEDISKHRMHGERFEISENAASAITLAKGEGRRIIAVGTTTARALESAAQINGSITAGKRTTVLFIAPGYEFLAVDAMLTNFHQPKSTLLMLVSALAGRELVLKCYAEAIRERYRLFSYGDCMLIA